MLFLASAILYGISTYIFPSQLGLNGAVALFGAAIIGIATFFSGVESASNIIEILLKPQKKFNFYKIKQYKQLLMNQNLFLDVRGLRTQGRFPLDLDLIFVELNLSPNSPNKLPGSFKGSNAVGGTSNENTIWKFIKNDEKRAARYLIIGLPGSGKTTLLRNIVSVLIAGSKIRKKYKAPNKLPILLNLRECAPYIEKNETFGLQDAVQNQIEKWNGQVIIDSLVKQINTGRCVIMLDGLDEVVNSDVRLKVARWIDKQSANYPNNPFIVTSRPFGYKDNPLQGMTILEVKPFSLEQVKKFIDNWYAANLFAEHGRAIKDYAREIKSKSEDLFKRVTSNQSLADLAVNPLLVTMMAIVHDNRGLLPTRRVELYDEIFDVLLERHQRSKEIPSMLSAKEQQKLLQPVAYYMMVNELREIPIDLAEDIVSKELLEKYLKNESDQILKQIENNGILYDASIDRYGFAHLTFQEYLAALHIKEKKLDNILPQKIEDSWWKETILLYAAKYDPSKFVDACLRKGANSPNLLALAAECVDEASVDLEPTVKHLFEDVFTKGVEHSDEKIRHVIAKANLTRRLRNLLRIGEDKFIDLGLISHSEYQLFLDEMFKEGIFFQPDHWKSSDFPAGLGVKPIAGVRCSDAKAFCSWLTKKEGPLWRFRLPEQKELELIAQGQEKHLSHNQSLSWLENGRIQNDFNGVSVTHLPMPQSQLPYLLYREHLFALYYCLTFVSFQIIDEISTHINSIDSNLRSILEEKQNYPNASNDLNVLDRFASALTDLKANISYVLDSKSENLIFQKDYANELVGMCQTFHMNFLKTADARKLARIHASARVVERETESLNRFLEMRETITEIVKTVQDDENEIGFGSTISPLKNFAIQFSDVCSELINNGLFKHVKVLNYLEAINTFIYQTISKLENLDSPTYQIENLIINLTLPEHFNPLERVNTIFQKPQLDKSAEKLDNTMMLFGDIFASLNNTAVSSISNTRSWLSNYKEYYFIRCVFAIKALELWEAYAGLRSRSRGKSANDTKSIVSSSLFNDLSLFYAICQIEDRSRNENLAFESIRIVGERNY